MSEIQKKIRRLELVNPHSLSAGFDAFDDNGIRLFRNIREQFFNSAQKLLECRHLEQNALFEYKQYIEIYRQIGDYKNYYTTANSKSLVMHDASIQPLLKLLEYQKPFMGVISNTTVLRDAKGGVRPLEKVRYHIEVPALHFLVPTSEIGLARQILTDFTTQFTKVLGCHVGIHPNRRDVGHYADWSVSADILIDKKPMEIVAGYQLSSAFSRELKANQFVFLEASISSRIIAGIIGYYMGRFGRGFVFPSNIAPYQINLIYSQERIADALSFYKDRNFSMYLCRHDRSGTSIFRKAKYCVLGNGAPMTVIMSNFETWIIRNLDFSVFQGTPTIDFLKSQLIISDQIFLAGTSSF